jgi:hypothetical protein
VSGQPVANVTEFIDVFTTADSGHIVIQLNSEHDLLTMSISGLVR